MKATALIMATMIASLGLSSARTWTSADGSKTFEGTVKSFDENSGKVTVTINGRQKVFTQDKLSEADQTFLKEWRAESSKLEVSEILASQNVGKHLTEKILSRLDGKRFKKTAMEKAPKYYLLYFSASW